MERVRLIVHGFAAAASVAFSVREQLNVAVIVKATFVYTPEGALSVCAPEPIASAEEPLTGGVGLRSAGDLAPYLGQADILLIGRARAPSGAPVTVGFALHRDGDVLIDKSIEVERAGDPIQGTGPRSREWPIRRALLGAVDPQSLDPARPTVAIPEGFDWGYFQAAPDDQRTAWLRGDEELVMSGVDAERPTIRARLPGARAAARLYGAAPGLQAGRPIKLLADTLLVDVDRRIVTMTWRGHFVVTSEAELASMHVVTGLELPGRPIHSEEPPPAERTPTSTPIPTPALPPERRHSATFVLEKEEVDRARAEPALPFSSAPPAALPFSSAPPAPPAPIASIASQPPDPLDESLPPETIAPHKLLSDRTSVLPFGLGSAEEPAASAISEGSAASAISARPLPKPTPQFAPPLGLGDYFLAAADEQDRR